MIIGRLLAWLLVFGLILLPLNWILLWFIDEISPYATLSRFLMGTVICWGAGVVLARYLLVGPRIAQGRKTGLE